MKDTMGAATTDEPTGLLEHKNFRLFLKELFGGYHIIGPCALLLLYAHSLVLFQIPSNEDSLDESGEPLKTLKFVYTRGRAPEKWGPLPNFLYAPVYAVPMAYWYATGDLGRPMTDYPYGFKRPHEQEGLLIVCARLLGLTVAVVCLAYYGQALYRFTGSRLAVFLVLSLFIASSSELSVKFVATKPDGLMLAFLAASTGVYADIISRGLNRHRGSMLSVLAVFSVSCKEQTAPAFAFMYVGLAVAGWLRTRGDRPQRVRFVADLAVTLVVGLVAYALLNVVYAPATWIERMKIWLVGSGKDPNVWAPSAYSLAAYLFDAWSGLFLNIGLGGVIVVGCALAASLVTPVRHRALIWLPSLGYLVTVLLIAGYMPPYFLSPLALTLALPVAAVLAYGERQWMPTAGRTLRAGVALAIVACYFANAWQGLLGPGRAVLASARVIEDYCVRHLSKSELIHTENLHTRQKGFSRLSYLGFTVDDRPLGALMDRPKPMPDVILLTSGHFSWMADLKNRPARTKMLEDTGYSYDRFPDLESLGYRHVEKVVSERSWLLTVPWIPPTHQPGYTELHVFRKGF